MASWLGVCILLVTYTGYIYCPLATATTTTVCPCCFLCRYIDSYSLTLILYSPKDTVSTESTPTVTVTGMNPTLALATLVPLLVRVAHDHIIVISYSP